MLASKRRGKNRGDVHSVARIPSGAVQIPGDPLQHPAVRQLRCMAELPGLRDEFLIEPPGRIYAQPLLEWKAQNVRRHKGISSDQVDGDYAK